MPHHRRRRAGLILYRKVGLELIQQPVRTLQPGVGVILPVQEETLFGIGERRGRQSLPETRRPPATRRRVSRQHAYRTRRSNDASFDFRPGRPRKPVLSVLWLRPGFINRFARCVEPARYRQAAVIHRGFAHLMTPSFSRTKCDALSSRRPKDRPACPGTHGRRRLSASPPGSRPSIRYATARR